MHLQLPQQVLSSELSCPSSKPFQKEERQHKTAHSSTPVKYFSRFLGGLDAVSVQNITKYLTFQDWLAVTQCFLTTQTKGNKTFVTRTANFWNTAASFTVCINVTSNITVQTQQHIYELLRTFSRIHWIIAVWPKSFPRRTNVQWFLRDCAILSKRCRIELRDLPFTTLDLPLLGLDQSYKTMTFEGWQNLKKLNLARGVSKQLIIRNCPCLSDVSADTCLNIEELTVWDCHALQTLSENIKNSAKVVDLGNCSALAHITLPSCATLHLRHNTFYTPQVVAPNAHTVHLSLNRVCNPEHVTKTALIAPRAKRLFLTGGGVVVGETITSIKASFIETLVFVQPLSITSLELNYPDATTFPFEQVLLMTNLQSFTLHQSCDTSESMQSMLLFIEQIDFVEMCEVHIFSPTLKLSFTKKGCKKHFTLTTPTTLWTCSSLQNHFFRRIRELFKRAVE